MEALEQKLYLELRTMERELRECLEKNTSSLSIRPYLEDELRDIQETMSKLESGSFGLCEASGEDIPPDYLSIIPTIKSLEDWEKIYQYYCKPIYM